MLVDVIHQDRILFNRTSPFVGTLQTVMKLTITMRIMVEIITAYRMFARVLLPQPLNRLRLPARNRSCINALLVLRPVVDVAEEHAAVRGVNTLQLINLILFWRHQNTLRIIIILQMSFLKIHHIYFIIIPKLSLKIK